MGARNRPPLSVPFHPLVFSPPTIRVEYAHEDFVVERVTVDQPPPLRPSCTLWSFPHRRYELSVCPSISRSDLTTPPPTRLQGHITAGGLPDPPLTSSSPRSSKRKEGGTTRRGPRRGGGQGGGRGGGREQEDGEERKEGGGCRAVVPPPARAHLPRSSNAVLP